MRASSHLISAVAVLLSLTGLSCSYRVTGVGSFPEPVVRLTIQPYTQEPERCGPYALAAVLSYLHFSVTPEEISERVYIPKIGGTLTMDLYLMAVRTGAEAEQLRGSTERVREDLDNRVPTIVLLRYGALLSGTGHFVVVSGYSLQPGGVFLQWGDGRESWMAQSGFERMWSRSDYWMLSFTRGRGA